jgi:hypothetical protein
VWYNCVNKPCVAAEEKPLLENVTQSRQRVKQLRDELEKEAKNMAEVSNRDNVFVSGLLYVLLLAHV